MAQKLERAGEVLLKFVGSTRFLILTIGWFVFSALWVMLSTPVGSLPDEGYHFSLTRVYAHYGPGPDLPADIKLHGLGDIVRTPSFLYHWLMSFPYKVLKACDLSAIQIMFVFRVVGIIFATLTLIYMAKLATRLKLPPVVRNLSVFMLGSTLMFIYLAGKVHYDNIQVFMVTLSFYLLVGLLRKHSANQLIGLVALLMLAPMVKYTSLIISVMIGAVLVWHYRTQFKKLWPGLRKLLAKRQRWTMALLALLVLTSALFISRIGVNVARYQQVAPNCDKVHLHDKCKSSGTYNRLVRFRNFTPPEGSVMPAPEFGWYWSKTMFHRTYGIDAKQKVSEPQAVTIGVLVFLAIAAVAAAWKWRPGLNPALSVILVIALLYGLSLLLKNYSTHIRTGEFFAIHSRYLFPVLPVLYISATYFVWLWLRTKARRQLFVALALVVFFLAGLPSYIYITDQSWHTLIMDDVNRALKNIVR